MIRINDVRLDPDNPRFMFQTEQKARSLTDAEMHKIILEDDETKTLMKALAKEGVKDPIWLRPDEHNNGKYIVIEGNRRITALRELARLFNERKLKLDDPRILEQVPANVYVKKISEIEALLQRARLQSGKEPWGPFSNAAVAYKLRNEMFMEIEDIAAELQISKAEVNKRIELYKQYHRFIEHTKIDNPSYFSYISEMPKKVKDWTSQSADAENEYFDWAKDGKIPSATTKGGLRELPLIIEDPEALKVLREPGKKMADALAVVEEKRIELQMPLLRRITAAENALRNITMQELEELKADKKKLDVIERLKERVDDILKKSRGTA
jgi:hypothetical protein